MKIRTAYFKVADMGKAAAFWEKLLGLAPQKRFPEWVEFRCENINFALLRLDSFAMARDAANCVPVFEVSAAERDRLKELALAEGGRVVVDIRDHPDRMSYVLADPFGNEFELTSFSDAA